jgi:hypothetical protein
MHQRSTIDGSLLKEESTVVAGFELVPPRVGFETARNADGVSRYQMAVAPLGVEDSRVVGGDGCVTTFKNRRRRIGLVCLRGKLVGRHIDLNKVPFR